MNRVLLFIFMLFCATSVQSAIEPDRLIIYPEYESETARDAIIREIKQAKSEIQMSAYQIKDEFIANALIESAEKGVRVKIIIEQTPYKHAFNKDVDQKKHMPRLVKAGIEVYNSPKQLKKRYPKGHYHARYILIDSKRFILTTGNFDKSTFSNCRDFAITFDKNKHPEEFNALQNLFEKDICDQPFTEKVPSSVIIGPEGQREKIIGFLKTAQKTIKLYQQYFNDQTILEVLTTLMKKKGIQIELIMMPYPTGYNKPDPSSALTQDKLENLGAKVGLMMNLYGHARAIIIDDESALIGTTQLSPPSLDDNRDISVIIKGPTVTQLVKQFEKDMGQTVSIKKGRAKALKDKRDWNKTDIHPFNAIKG